MSDPHSRFRPEHPRLRHIDVQFEVDFDAQVLHATAALRFERPGPAQVVLDTRALDITGVHADGNQVPFELSSSDAVLGEGLTFDLPDGADAVTVSYRTDPGAAALQWLEPAQTAGGKLHYLFTQAQSINARSFIPLQDTMGSRITYTAEVTVPPNYVVRMSADAAGIDQLDDGRRRYRFIAPRALAPYLIALVIGDLVSQRIGPRSTIWAEPCQLAAAAREFEDIEAVVRASEELYGPYRWGSADLLVMPPSYPLGGMENPQLTYAAATLVTGDKSAVNVVIHEIAHHWSGNLVSGESLEHFWVNEGPTVYGEWRVTERLYGRETAELLAAVEYEDLLRNIDSFAERPQMTRLRRRLDGIDPEADFSLVAHHKGFLFIRAIEEAVGRDRFDPVFREFFDTFAFGTVSSEQFVAWVEERLPGAVDWSEWLFGEGIPAGAPRPRSSILDEIETLGSAPPSVDLAARWGSVGWQVYLSRLPADDALLTELDEQFQISGMPNPDIDRQWIVLGLRAGSSWAVQKALRLVRTVGRMKYLVPVYDALKDRDAELAQKTYRETRSWYHPLARSALDSRFPTWSSKSA